MAIDSKLSSYLKKLSTEKPTDAMPSMPAPMFDKYLGGSFKKKKKS